MMGCFVTGTDTGVGKTLVSAGLLHALARHHRRVVGMKPVAAGLVPWGEDWASEDAIALRSASTLAVPPALDNPVLLPDPLSPHIAAARAGVEIDIAAIVTSYQALAAGHMAHKLALLGRTHVHQHGLARLHQRPRHRRAHATSVVQPLRSGIGTGGLQGFGQGDLKGFGGHGQGLLERGESGFGWG